MNVNTHWHRQERVAPSSLHPLVIGFENFSTFILIMLQFKTSYNINYDDYDIIIIILYIHSEKGVHS